MFILIQLVVLFLRKIVLLKIKTKFMQKKILLKTAREYLQNSFPENLFPVRKLRNTKKNLLFLKVNFQKYK